ncbi:Acyl-CoA:lysophosphatidylglycerol acyltransferase 1 [Intoshia linei]|uniref:Acyl-CoA:lysophosphatidylglycerol acyltransferase 1 n=1 Tax=Intoshia linei TaxID=1819745 RepID=A0A177AXW0_9BILA|nr:Acyl-CoA:lysophosphatidylglycerol acyltransferase 1 [Intoshia linei]
MHNVGMGAVRVILFTVACLICIPVHVLFISVFYIALGFINIEWFDKLESLLYNNLLFIVGTFVACGKYKVTIIGDDIETIRLEKTLILSNHQSTADVPLFMYIFTEHYRDISKQIMWIMEGLFKFVPFGWVSLWHSDHFLSKKDTIPNIEKHLIKSYRLDRKWYIVFPEGGFFYKHYESNKRYAFRNNLPVLENVILPRTGCLSGILKNEKIKWIVDLTVIYTPETPSFYDMISASKEGNIIIVVKKINIEDVQKSIDSEIFKTNISNLTNKMRKNLSINLSIAKK